MSIEVARDWRRRCEHVRRFTRWKRRLAWAFRPVWLIVDSVAVLIGISLIANGDALYGAVLVFVGAYWLASEIVALVNRRGRVEGLRIFFALGFFFVLAAWIGVGAVLSFIGEGRWGVVIGLVGFIFSALGLLYGTRIVVA